MTCISGAELYTVGYEGRALDEFIDELLDSRVEALVDVREMPVSRKPGFSKSKLSERISEEGLEYFHFRSLGSPRDARKRFKESGDFGSFATEYLGHLREQPEDMETLLELIASGRRVALMCFERDHQRCHRALLVGEMLASAGGEDSDIWVCHL